MREHFRSWPLLDDAASTEDHNAGCDLLNDCQVVRDKQANPNSACKLRNLACTDTVKWYVSQRQRRIRMPMRCLPQGMARSDGTSHLRVTQPAR
ncbi:hypothetical protein PH30N_00795 [Cutibacterium modestum 30N]|nr:hypothetical protein [Cutibacterium modestum 28N]MCP2379634.1 hypothetical protein [Cutibacterium modestum 30N]